MSVEVLFTGLYLFWSLSGNCFVHALRGVMGDRSRESRHLDAEAAWNQGDGPVPTWAASPGGAEGKGSAVSQTHVLPCKKKERRKKECSWGNSDQRTLQSGKTRVLSLLRGHLGALSEHLGLWSPSFCEGSLRCIPFLSEVSYTPPYGYVH